MLDEVRCEQQSDPMNVVMVYDFHPHVLVGEFEETDLPKLRYKVKNSIKDYTNMIVLCLLSIRNLFYLLMRLQYASLSQPNPIHIALVYHFVIGYTSKH